MLTRNMHRHVRDESSARSRRPLLRLVTLAITTYAASGCSSSFFQVTPETGPRGATTSPAKPAAQPPKSATKTVPVTVIAAPAAPVALMVRDTIAPEPEPLPSDSAGVARLQRLIQLWHIGTLYHSSVIERGAPWDSAFVRTATAVRATNDPQRLADAYRKMLSVLNDPLSRVELNATAASASEVARFTPGSERTRDSILIVRVPLGSAQPAVFTDSLANSVRQQLLASGRRVVLDLRAASASATTASGSVATFSANDADSFAKLAMLAEQLNTTSLMAASARARRVGGSRMENGQHVPDDAWLVRGGDIVVAGSAVNRRVVVLANRATIIPRAILSLIATGRATLLAEEAVDEVALAPSVLLPIADGVNLRVRTGDVVNVDGTVGVIADSVLPRAASASDSAPVLRAALAMLRSNRVTRASRIPVRTRAALLPGYYSDDPYPFMGARLLAGAKLWSAIRVRHVHRELYDEDMDARFEQTIPRLESARTAQEYAAALLPLVSALDDASASLWGQSADSARGIATAPFRVRWIEDRAIITDVVRDSVTRALGIEAGMEVTAADGFPMPAWVIDHRAKVSATNSWTRMRLLMQLMPKGPSGGALFRLRDATNRERQLNIPRSAAYVRPLLLTERPLATAVRMLPGDILYADMERLSPDSASATLLRAAGVRALILDLRGDVGNEQAARVLAALRTTPDAVIAREVRRYETEPCIAMTLRDARAQCTQTRETRPRLSRAESTSRYAGPIVVLIDERTEGDGERLALALDAASRVTFIGSATAGSAGDVMTLDLPGLLNVAIPIVELRRADDGQVQRVGITPSVDARSTVRGVRTGIDEVIERAQQWITQRLAPPAPRRR